MNDPENPTEEPPANALSTQVAQPPSAMAASWLTPTNLEAGLRLADLMSKAKLVPQHLQGQPSDCLLVISQAARWGMDPFAVAQSTAVVRGKLCYEGKLVAAALVATRAIEEGGLDYEFEGEGQGMSIIISGTPRGSGKLRTMRGSVLGWRTENGQWDKDPQSMLVYRGTRQWARLYAPACILGVVTPDEVDTEPKAAQDVVVRDGVPEAQAPRGKAAKAAKAKEAEAVQAQLAETVVVDPRIAQMLAEAEALHRDRGALAAAELRAISQQLGLKRLSDCGPDKIERALEMVANAKRLLGGSAAGAA